MNLQFDSIAELEQFLMFTAHIGRAFQTQVVQDEVQVIAPKRTLEEFDAARQGESIEPQSEEGDGLHAASAPHEKPKRTCRTKAEIEAERVQQSVTETLERAGETPAAAAQMAQEAAQTEPEPRGNPFAAAPGIQAILDASNQTSATLAAAAALADAPAQTRADRVAEIMAEGTLTDSLAHLKYCQKFIQTHGMSKYNESFAEGLKVNIADYSPAQCALHVALLEELA